MKKLLITDVDGTLFNTIDVNYMAYKDVCEKHGVIIDKEYYLSNMFGKYYRTYLPDLFPKADYAFYELIHDRKKMAYKKYIKLASVNGHLLRIVDALKSDYYITIVTTACRDNTNDIIQSFGVEGLFDEIITQEDVKKVKPDPEGFLKAMDYFGVSPKDTLIFEDSDVGIEAAIKSGANVMRIESGFVS